MGFLSYAQNFEDVMLWRAVGHVTDGVYVDIGAQHPRIDSVSRAFYERGWRGVHVEPVPAFADLLRQDRPDETVLQVALGEHEGTLELNVFPDTGLSTAVAAYAERHRTERGYQTERIQVPLLTMGAALGFLDGKEVHWLKIDVEGFEEQVLRGWDSQQLRPWVLVVEATVPNSTETDHEKWEHLVLAAGYRFVYFDGLNRFYIANERPELAAAFAAPPNIFDAVEVSGEASWGLCNVAVANYQGQVRDLTGQLQQHEEEAARAAVSRHALETQLAALTEQIAQNSVSAALAQEQLEGQLRESERRLQALQEENAAAIAKAEELKHTSYYWWHTAEELRAQVQATRTELDQVYGSKSWRLSLPLRVLNARTGRVRNFAGRAARWALRQPARVARAVTGRQAPDGATGAAASQVVVMSQANAPTAARRLSPRAARLYAELKQVVEKGSE